MDGAGGRGLFYSGHIGARKVDGRIQTIQYLVKKYSRRKFILSNRCMTTGFTGKKGRIFPDRSWLLS
jgi:hypothetical protein